MARALAVFIAAILVPSAQAQVKPESAPRDSPLGPPAWAVDLRGVLELLLKGQHEQAIRAADAFVARHPLSNETFSVLLIKAESQYRLSRVDDAIHTYQQAMPFIQQLSNVSQRRFVMAFFRLGLLYRRKAQYDTAIRFVEAGLTREPQSAYHQILLAELLRERGDKEKALKHFTTVLGSPTPTPEERVVIRIKLDCLGATTPAGVPLDLALQPLTRG